MKFTGTLIYCGAAVFFAFDNHCDVAITLIAIRMMVNEFYFLGK